MEISIVGGGLLDLTLPERRTLELEEEPGPALPTTEGRGRDGREERGR